MALIHGLGETIARSTTILFERDSIQTFGEAKTRRHMKARRVQNTRVRPIGRDARDTLIRLPADFLGRLLSQQRWLIALVIAIACKSMILAREKTPLGALRLAVEEYRACRESARKPNRVDC